MNFDTHLRGLTGVVQTNACHVYLKLSNLLSTISNQSSQVKAQQDPAMTGRQKSSRRVPTPSKLDNDRSGQSNTSTPNLRNSLNASKSSIGTRPKRRASQTHFFKYQLANDPWRAEEEDLRLALLESLQQCPDDGSMTAELVDSKELIEELRRERRLYNNGMHASYSRYSSQTSASVSSTPKKFASNRNSIAPSPSKCLVKPTALPFSPQVSTFSQSDDIDSDASDIDIDIETNEFSDDEVDVDDSRVKSLTSLTDTRDMLNIICFEHSLLERVASELRDAEQQNNRPVTRSRSPAVAASATATTPNCGRHSLRKMPRCMMRSTSLSSDQTTTSCSSLNSECNAHATTTIGCKSTSHPSLTRLQTRRQAAAASASSTTNNVVVKSDIDEPQVKRSLRLQRTSVRE